MRGLLDLEGRDVSLYVRVEGEGDPLLLMHGGPGADHSTMLPFLELADRHRLVLYDHRCNGRSVGAAVSTMTWENLTADAEALREALGIEKWAVLGHSFGGMVALEYAIRYPGSVSRLCILDSGGDARLVREQAPQELQRRGYSRVVVDTARRFFAGKIQPSELIRSMLALGRAYYSRATPGLVLRETFHALRIRPSADACIFGFGTLLAGWSVMERLRGIQVPALVLAGAGDFQFPPAHQELLAAGMGSAQLRIIAGAGHNAPAEKPAEVIAAVREFLGG